MAHFRAARQPWTTGAFFASYFAIHEYTFGEELARSHAAIVIFAGIVVPSVVAGEAAPRSGLCVESLSTS